MLLADELPGELPELLKLLRRALLLPVCELPSRWSEQTWSTKGKLERSHLTPTAFSAASGAAERDNVWTTAD